MLYSLFKLKKLFNGNHNLIISYGDIIYKNKVLTEVKYEVILLKEREEDDVGVSLRDDYGRLLKKFKDDPKWVVFHFLFYIVFQF